MKRRAIFCLLLVAGCASAVEEDDGDMGDDEANTPEVATALATKCSASRSDILASATGDRRDAIERGFTWLDKNVQYSQSRSYQGFRTDCSGFVSMCWDLNRSYTTADFSSGGGDSYKLSTYDQLQPGDALVRRSRGQGHVVLFLGWNDASKKAACVIEQNSTALDMEFGTRTTASLKASGFSPIRADKFR